MNFTGKHRHRMRWCKKKSIPGIGHVLKRRNLDRSDQWHEVLGCSADRPVVLFKHSRRCGLSSVVLKRFEKGFLTDDFREFSYYFLDVVQDRQISDQVARDLQVVHESPQVILISKGEAAMHASHYDIVDLTDNFLKFMADRR